MKTYLRFRELILTISVLALATMAAQSVRAEDTLAKVKEKGLLVAGIRSDNPPVGYYGENGKLAGFAVDIANAIAGRLGVEIELVPTNSKTRVPLVKGGRVDAEFGSTTPTRQRDEVVDFTIVYLWDAVVPLVRKGDSLRHTDYGPPKKAASTQGNFTIPLFLDDVPDGDVVIFQEFPDAVVALLNGKLDTVLMARFAAASWAKKYKGKFAVGEVFFEDPQAIIVRENDSNWRDELNFMLQEMWSEGEFQKIHEKNFGYPPSWQNIWSDRRLQPGLHRK